MKKSNQKKKHKSTKDIQKTYLAKYYSNCFLFAFLLQKVWKVYKKKKKLLQLIITLIFFIALQKKPKVLKL